MSFIPVIESEVVFNVEGAGKTCKTWYTIFGTLRPDVRPLVCLHGGPGVPHNYLLPIKALSSTRGIPIVMYDQLGCGNSTHLPEKNGDCDFWTVSLFLSELSNLLTHLNIQNYDLLGQSWGGMLAACHAIRQPRGLHRLIIADSPASMDLWVEAADQLRAQLPAAVQEVLLKCEREGNTDSKEYEEAMEVYYDRHVCRVKPAPVEFQTSMDKLKEDQTVFLTMNGPSEFFITGMLKTWSIVDEVYKINVPTLLINGKYDEAQDSVMEPFFRSIEKVKWVRFGESSHLPQLEEPEEFLKVVSSFLMTKG